MTTLCIDTATEDGIVVVARADGTSASVRWRAAGRHAENLFGHIETALAEAGTSRDELSLIGVDIGPGKFTSLRVGLATAKGLAFGLGLPIVGVSSLRVRARSIEAASHLVRVPLMNAYRGDVFSAAYALDGERLDEIVAPTFGTPDEMLRRIRDAVADRPVAMRGEGASPAALAVEVDHAYRARGADDLVMLEPRYLRPSDAKLPSRPLRTDHVS